MIKKITLLSLLLFSFSCNNIVSSNNSEKLDSNKISNKSIAKIDKINFTNMVGLNMGFIDVYYNNKLLKIGYKKESEKYKLNEISYTNNPKEETIGNLLINIFPYDIEPNKDKKEALKKIVSTILDELKTLKGNEDENELIKISTSLIEGKELDLFIDKVDLHPNSNKNFVEFTKISDTEFKLELKDKNMFLSLNDKVNNKVFYVKNGLFKVNESGFLVSKDKNYSLEIVLYPKDKENNREDMISKIDNLGRVYAKFGNNPERILSDLPIIIFKNSEKLKFENDFYSEIIDSDKPERINLSELNFKNVLKLKI